MVLCKLLHLKDMLTPIGGGGTCITRANTTSSITKTKSEDESRKQTDIGVKDLASAIKFLLDSEFKSEDNVVNFELLSGITMQLSQ